MEITCVAQALQLGLFLHPWWRMMPPGPQVSLLQVLPPPVFTSRSQLGRAQPRAWQIKGTSVISFWESTSVPTTDGLFSLNHSLPCYPVADTPESPVPMALLQVAGFSPRPSCSRALLQGTILPSQRRTSPRGASPQVLQYGAWLPLAPGWTLWKFSLWVFIPVSMTARESFSGAAQGCFIIWRSLWKLGAGWVGSYTCIFA